MLDDVVPGHKLECFPEKYDYAPLKKTTLTKKTNS